MSSLVRIQLTLNATAWGTTRLDPYFLLPKIDCMQSLASRTNVILGPDLLFDCRIGNNGSKPNEECFLFF